MDCVGWGEAVAVVLPTGVDARLAQPPRSMAVTSAAAGASAFTTVVRCPAFMPINFPPVVVDAPAPCDHLTRRHLARFHAQARRRYAGQWPVGLMAAGGDVEYMQGALGDACRQSDAHHGLPGCERNVRGEHVGRVARYISSRDCSITRTTVDASALPTRSTPLRQAWARQAPPR